MVIEVAAVQRNRTRNERRPDIRILFPVLLSIIVIGNLDVLSAMDVFGIQ